MKWLGVASLALCLSLAFSIVVSAPAMASPSSNHPKTVVYSNASLLRPDGVVHLFYYPKMCSNGRQGCYVKITVVATIVKDIHGVHPGASQPYDPGYDETVTDDYVTCTGIFGNCIQFTEAKLTSTYTIHDGSVVSWFDQYRYCGANGWTCQGVAGIFNEQNYAGVGSILTGYGPQLYNGINSSQTKYARIVMQGGGNYYFINTCAGYLC